MTFYGTPGVIELNASLFNIQQVPKNTILHEIPGKTKCKRIFPHCLKKKLFKRTFHLLCKFMIYHEEFWGNVADGRIKIVGSGNTSSLVPGKE